MPGEAVQSVVLGGGQVLISATGATDVEPRLPASRPFRGPRDLVGGALDRVVVEHPAHRGGRVGDNLVIGEPELVDIGPRPPRMKADVPRADDIDERIELGRSVTSEEGSMGASKTGVVGLSPRR
jgi:hypothetical protein